LSGSDRNAIFSNRRGKRAVTEATLVATDKAATDALSGLDEGGRRRIDDLPDGAAG
jgi:hypothetical protein